MSSSLLHKRIKKDYQRKNLPNPFFRRKLQSNSRFLANFFIFFSVFLIIFLVWFFCAAPFWRLQEIKINGLTRLDGLEIKKIILEQATQKRWIIFKQNNLLLFKDSVAREKIIVDYNLAGAQIKKEWPRTLNILISERPYAFIFQEGITMFYASANGYVIKEPSVVAEDTKKYFILENKNSGSLIGEKDKINIKSNYLDFVLELNWQLTSHPDLLIEKFIIDQEFNTIKVKFLNGPLVYFSTNDSATNQVNNLLLVKNGKIKDNFSKTNYIDLRYGDKIYINPDFK